MKKGSCGVKPVKLHRIRAITMKKKRLTMENKREIVGFVFISPWIIGFLMFFCFLIVFSSLFPDGVSVFRTVFSCAGIYFFAVRPFVFSFLYFQFFLVFFAIASVFFSLFILVSVPIVAITLSAKFKMFFSEISYISPSLFRDFFDIFLHRVQICRIE